MQKNNFNIDSPELIQCNFPATLIEEPRSISNDESVPVPVINILLEYGKNFTLSAF